MLPRHWLCTVHLEPVGDQSRASDVNIGQKYPVVQLVEGLHRSQGQKCPVKLLSVGRQRCLHCPGLTAAVPSHSECLLEPPPRCRTLSAAETDAVLENDNNNKNTGFV